MNRSTCLLAALLFLPASLITAQAQGVDILRDPLNYSAWSTGASPMSAAWTNNNGSVLSVVNQIPSSTTSFAASLNSNVVYRDIAVPLTTDFELELDALHTLWQRSIWVGIFNSAGTQGYGFTWNSNNGGPPPQYNSEGSVTIRKYTVTAPATPATALVYNVYSTPVTATLGSTAGSGHNAGNTTDACMTAPYAKFKLTWNRTTGSLKLYVDGVLKCSATDTSYTSFSRVYIGGGSGCLFDNVAVRLPGGATVPWKSFEAENGTAGGGATLLTGTTWGEIAYEARGKKMLELNADGEYVEWTNVPSATHLTIRYSLIAGTSDSIKVYVNGGLSATVSLLSDRMHESKSTTEVPGGVVRFFDEVTVAVSIPASATVRLQHGTGSTRQFIDFMEVETAPTAATKPDSTWVSVSGTDAAAIRTAISTAKSGSKKVWLPAGNYSVDSQIVVDPGIEIRGAGIWHTRVTKQFSGANARMFRISGSGNIMRDFKAIDSITTLSGNSSNCIFDANDSTSFLIKGIWTEYATLALAYRATSLTVQNCRIRNGYKDAIHVATTANNCLIENCAFRNTGDDSAAFVNYSSNPGLYNNKARYNTMECSYWGRGIALHGGDSMLAEYNLVTDCSKVGILVAIDGWNDPIEWWPYNTNFMVRNNVLLRCGNQKQSGDLDWGASLTVWGRTNRPMQGSVTNNYVLSPPYHGAQLSRYVGQAGTSYLVTFEKNTIAAPGAGGTYDHLNTDCLYPDESNCDYSPNTLLP